MIDIASGGGYFVSTHSLVGLLQMVVQVQIYLILGLSLQLLKHLYL
jgi:hypothetical protein